MKIYSARPGATTAEVVDGGNARRLPRRRDLVNHSPTGFAWGYAGSGPAQLALALLADALGDDRRALDLYQDFKARVVAAWPQDQGWSITADEVRRIAGELEAEWRLTEIAERRRA